MTLRVMTAARGSCTSLRELVLDGKWLPKPCPETPYTCEDPNVNGDARRNLRYRVNKVSLLASSVVPLVFLMVEDTERKRSCRVNMR